MSLTFDPVEHRYFWNGAPVTNVTRALGLLSDWSKVDPVVLENARQEGVDQHRMVELYMKDDLDEATLPEWLVPRLAAFKSFKAATGFLCIESELRVYNPRYAYAGTTDLIGTINITLGRHSGTVVACIDLKRSFAGGRVIGYQLAAYTDAWNKTRVNAAEYVTHRYALKLHADGQFRLEPYTDRADIDHFLTCLRFYNLKESLK